MKYSALPKEVERISKLGDFYLYKELAERIATEGAEELLLGMIESKELLGNLDVLSEDHVYMYREKNFNFLLRFLGGDADDDIYGNEYDFFVINPLDEEVVIPRFTTMAGSIDGECLSPPQGLTVAAEIRIKPREIVYIKAFSDILDFSEATPKDGFALLIHSERKGWTTWTYSREDFSPRNIICTDLTASRMQLYIKFLGELRLKSTIDSLRKVVLSDYASFVRWEAVEALEKIGDPNLVELIESLSMNEKDPVIRTLAAQCFFAADQQEEL
ncbi:HEAT repeat domain-containing protein [Pseudomonas aeruginosa]|uniref:HEAT repeat domain-containing protein n=1 Tax=Pseudomonas aeruginosa TaxID=287 RepID=UPI001A29D378|nr:HEAT repeat domain-containing protein [Pseudomonas aeruginosa]